MSNNEIDSVENEVKSIVRHQPTNSPTQASTTAASCATIGINGLSTTRKQKKKSLLSYFLDTLVGADTKQINKQSSALNNVLTDEFKVYKKLAGQFVSTSFDLYDPLSFWKQNKSLLPNLSPLAQKYLASPGTSVESAFSTSSYYGRKQRARLSSENLSFSVFLKDKLLN